MQIAIHLAAMQHKFTLALAHIKAAARRETQHTTPLALAHTCEAHLIRADGRAIANAAKRIMAIERDTRHQLRHTRTNT